MTNQPSLYEQPNVSETPPKEIEEAIEQLFQAHQLLSDFIFKKSGIPTSLEILHRKAKLGEWEANSDPVLWLRRFTDAIEDEVKELRESLPWKWWRHEKADMQNVRIELIDIMHFVISAAQASGMDGRQFTRLYYMKRKLNFDRQINGFVKDDNRDLKV